MEEIGNFLLYAVFYCMIKEKDAVFSSDTLISDLQGKCNYEQLQVLFPSITILSEGWGVKFAFEEHASSIYYYCS